MRVVQGSPISWEPSVATAHDPSFVWLAVWSPCSKLIAAVWGSKPKDIKILDAVTLEKLSILESQDDPSALSFSPDSYLLTQFSHGGKLTNWDLQTGGLVGAILPEPDIDYGTYISSTYSPDGKMIAAAYWNNSSSTGIIFIYNLLSTTFIHSHQVSDGCIIPTLQTHGECVQFTTVKPGSITIWEVGFTSTHPLVEIKSLPTPDMEFPFQELHQRYNVLSLPALHQLASTLSDEVFVWDAQDSRFLLKFSPPSNATSISFSPDGRFFACKTCDGEVYLWKESPTGYVLHQTVTLPDSTGRRGIFLSPNGGSVVVLGGTTLHLWHTTDPITPPSSVPTKSFQTNFILEFSPDRTFSAVGWHCHTTVTVLNLKSGCVQLTIDTGMEVIGLKVTGGTITAISKGKVVTWNLPMGDCNINARANISNSIQTTTFDYHKSNHPKRAFMSPNLNLVATTWYDGREEGLNIFNVSTGKPITDTDLYGRAPWFSPDGCEVWCRFLFPMGGKTASGWAITETDDGGSSHTVLGPLGSAACLWPSGGFPWESPCGHKITGNGWLLNSNGKRLMWLPHNWRLDDWDAWYHRKWAGQFLGLSQHGLQEAVILEVLDK